MDDINLQIAFKQVRDATFCNENITNSEKVAILEQVKFEILRNNQEKIDNG